MGVRFPPPGRRTPAERARISPAGRFLGGCRETALERGSSEFRPSCSIEEEGILEEYVDFSIGRLGRKAPSPSEIGFSDSLLGVSQCSKRKEEQAVRQKIADACG